MRQKADNRPSSSGAVIQFFNPAGDDANLRMVRGQNVDHVFPCHIHRSYILGTVTSGKRIFLVEGKETGISAPDCFIINPFQAHSCRWQGKAGHDYRVISVNRNVMRKAYQYVFGQGGLPNFPSIRISDPFITDLLRELLDRVEPGVLPDEEALFNFLVILIRKFSGKKPADELFLEKTPYVNQVSKYIEKNAGQQIELDLLSRMVHISPFHLNRIFREKIGIPPKAYLLQVRIKKSVNLLLETRSISRVALEMGFADQSHFSRFFKRNVGVSPGRFLEMNGTGTR